MFTVLVGDGGGQELSQGQPGAELDARDLDVAQGEQRVDDHRRQIELAQLLAHDLAMHLARCRDVDHGVAEDGRGATQAMPGADRSAAAVLALER